MSEKEEEAEWLEDLSKLDVGGVFVPSAEGLIVTFKLIDHTQKPEEVKKTFEGKDAGVKYQWKVTVHGLSFIKKAYREVLEDKKPEKIKMIDEFEKGKESILELSKTATKQLALFMLENQITSENLIKYQRIGESRNTEYKFSEVTTKEASK